MAGEVFLLSVDWRRRPTEDPIWVLRRDGPGDGSPMDLRQCLPVGVLRGGSVLEEGLDCWEELGPEGLADQGTTGTRIGGDHRIGGVARAESSQQELLAEHGQLATHQEHLCLAVQVVLGGHHHGSSGDGIINSIPPLGRKGRKYEQDSEAYVNIRPSRNNISLQFFLM